FVRTHGERAVVQAPFSDLFHELDRGAVSAVAIDGDRLDVTLTDGHMWRTNAPANYVAANPSFITELSRKNVRVDIRASADQAAYSYGALALGIAFVGVLAFTLFRVSSGRIPALESKTREAGPEASAVTFDDVAGVDEAKEEVKEVVD